MNSSARLAILLGLQLSAGAGLLACGGDDPAEGENDDSAGERADGGTESTGSGTLQLSYAPMYSAFIEGGAHEAQVPVTLKDTSLRGKGAKFTSSDPSIAVVTDTPEGGLVTVKKEGTVTIRAALDGDTGAAKLTITKFTEAQWMTGQARYSKMDLAISPKDGSPVSIIALASDRTAYNPNGACNTCHTAQAKTLKIENTPTQIAGYSDAELITIFTMGKKPEGVAQKTMVPSFAWGMLHSWMVTEEEKQGLIAFLRTQTPKANPATVDYGVKLCEGAPVPMNGEMPMLCDNNGKPISFGGDAGTARPDAGAATPDAGAQDAGATADAS
jgi:hypothetical protein